MEGVGESGKRNEEFRKSFDRLNLIRSVVDQKAPVILDIGAHRGESVRYLQEAFPESVIYSVEPDPDSFQALLAANFQNHHCLNLALSNVNSEITFFRNDISHTNSILRVNLKSRDSIKIQEAIKNRDSALFDTFNHEIKVSAITLDALIMELSIPRIDLLKIDVQGAESMVLEGGPEALKVTGALLLEVSFFDYYERKSSFFEIEQHLRPCGLELFSITELSQNPMNGRTDWAEVLYKKAAAQGG
ncbi:MAG: FkbM family methyltransferase [Steroidobacteraceae bacterium]